MEKSELPEIKLGERAPAKLVEKLEREYRNSAERLVRVIIRTIRGGIRKVRIPESLLQLKSNGSPGYRSCLSIGRDDAQCETLFFSDGSTHFCPDHRRPVANVRFNAASGRGSNPGRLCRKGAA